MKVFKKKLMVLSIAIVLGGFISNASAGLFDFAYLDAVISIINQISAKLTTTNDKLSNIDSTVAQSLVATPPKNFANQGARSSLMDEFNTLIDNTTRNQDNTMLQDLVGNKNPQVTNTAAYNTCPLNKNGVPNKDCRDAMNAQRFFEEDKYNTPNQEKIAKQFLTNISGSYMALHPPLPLDNNSTSPSPANAEYTAFFKTATAAQSVAINVMANSLARRMIPKTSGKINPNNDSPLSNFKSTSYSLFNNQDYQNWAASAPVLAFLYDVHLGFTSVVNMIYQVTIDLEQIKAELASLNTLMFISDNYSVGQQLYDKAKRAANAQTSQKQKPKKNKSGKQNSSSSTPSPGLSTNNNNSNNNDNSLTTEAN